MKELATSILIVDDDLDLLMLLERTLVKKGFVVETAASIPEAEDILRHIHVDVILLDVNINGEDGRKLCWEVKHGELHQIKVIIMTGFDLSLGRAALFGADDLVAKPFDPEFLNFKIGEVLQRKTHQNNA